ncbi:hypothetical protein Droror1_Dr00013789 [Drosera rotundifolia]
MHTTQQSLAGASEATAGIFPVLFFDGERETEIGTVVVSASTTFKTFQSLISQKIGISPHQITIYLERNHHQINGFVSTATHHHRKIPVTNKFNFAAIAGDNSCFFRAVLKRSRRARRRRPTSKEEMISYHNNGYNNSTGIISPENFVLLRRGGSYPGLIPSPVQYDHPVQYDQPVQYDPALYEQFLDYKMRIIEEEKARYLMTLNMNSNVYSDPDFDWNSSEIGDDAASSGSGSRENNNRVVCEFCESYEAKEGETVPFHFCAYDEEVKGVFVSRAGPIARPTKPKSPEKES